MFAVHDGEVLCMYLIVIFWCWIRIRDYESFSTALFESAVLLTWINTYLYLYTFTVIKCRKKYAILISQDDSIICEVEIL